MARTKIKKTKSLQSLNYNEVCKQIKQKNFYIEYIDKKDSSELIIKFEDIRLPTLNELLSGLQYRKFEIYNYKKTVKEVMSEILTELKNKVGKEFLFNEYVDLIIFRQGKKLIDNDSLPACFKYFIDSLTNNNIIKDDNPDFIQNIRCYQRRSNEKMLFILKLKQSKKDKIQKEIEEKEDNEIFDFIKQL